MTRACTVGEPVDLARVDGPLSRVASPVRFGGLRDSGEVAPSALCTGCAELSRTGLSAPARLPAPGSLHRSAHRRRRALEGGRGGGSGAGTAAAAGGQLVTLVGG